MPIDLALLPSDVRQEGDWVYLPREAVENRHPLYGLDGWPILLFFGLFVGPVLNLALTVKDAAELPNYAYSYRSLFYLMSAAAFLSWWPGVRLVRRAPDFQQAYTICILILTGFGFIITVWLVGGRGRLLAAGLGAQLPHLIVGGIWLLYVWCSKRINVTCKNRVRLTDPFLEKIISNKLESRKAKQAQSNDLSSSATPIKANRSPPVKDTLATLSGIGRLRFKTNQAAFEYACGYMDCELAPGKLIPALVQSANKIVGSSWDVIREEDGEQTATLKVASRDGGFLVVAVTLSQEMPDLQVGDFVGWHAGMFKPDLAATADDERFGWIGFIVAILKPELDPKRGWAIAETG